MSNLYVKAKSNVVESETSKQLSLPIVRLNTKTLKKRKKINWRVRQNIQRTIAACMTKTKIIINIHRQERTKRKKKCTEKNNEEQEKK